MENKWRAWLSRIMEKGKMPKKNQLLILMLIGILLVVIVFPVSDSNEGTGAISKEENEAVDIQETENYEKSLERRVAKTLEYVDGVGRAEVMITLKSSGEKIIEKDQQTSSQKTDEKDSKGGTRTSEDRITDYNSVYEQESDGAQSPYVSKEMAPEIEGVVVIADGGDNPVVVQNITEAVQALFGVEAHKIKIMKRTDT